MKNAPAINTVPNRTVLYTEMISKEAESSLVHLRFSLSLLRMFIHSCLNSGVVEMGGEHSNEVEYVTA